VLVVLSMFASGGLKTVGRLFAVFYPWNPYR